MNKGCYGSSVGIIIAQFKDCDKGHIFKSLSGPIERYNLIWKENRWFMRPLTRNCTLNSADTFWARLGQKKMTNSTCLKEDKIEKIKSKFN